MNRKIFALLTVMVALLATSCGYRTSGSQTRLPAEVKTIAIPVFTNQTQTYRIEQMLTEAVVREFLDRSNYKVLNEASADADATLSGTVTSVQVSPITYDSQTGRASSALVTMRVRVSLTDRNGRVLYDNPSYTFREQYQITREVASFFQEESPALERMSRDFGRTLVSNVLEAF